MAIHLLYPAASRFRQWLMDMYVVLARDDVNYLLISIGLGFETKPWRSISQR